MLLQLMNTAASRNTLKENMPEVVKRLYINATMRVDADLEFIIAGSLEEKKLFFSKQDDIWYGIN